MLKTIVAATLSILAVSAYAKIEIYNKPDNVYSFKIKDSLKSFQAIYAMGIDESILLKCNNKENNEDKVSSNCKIDLTTVKDFDISDKDITGLKMLIIPLSIEKDILKANIVYKQRIDETHAINYHMNNQILKLNEQNVIKLTDENDLYISIKKEEY